jgi:hypothetical protein
LLSACKFGQLKVWSKTGPEKIKSFDQISSRPAFDPRAGSRISSTSTGGAAMKAIITGEKLLSIRGKEN